MVIVALILLGLCFGSFTNAFVWRLHEQTGSRVKGRGYSKNSKKLHPSPSTLHPSRLSIWKGRSMCPDCKHELSATDLVPILSWLGLRGKCRYCHKPISWQYPLVEALTALLFVASYLWWPYSFVGLGVVQFGLWLVCVVFFLVLAVYDLRWMLLPNKLVYSLAGVAALLTIIRVINSGEAGHILLGSFLGVVCTAGFFYVLFQASNGKWIGGGDVKLAIALGLLVGGALGAVQMLFLASLAGSVISIVLIVFKGAKRTTQVPFGPFLLMGTYIVYLWGAQITLWYERLILGV